MRVRLTTARVWWLSLGAVVAAILVSIAVASLAVRAPRVPPPPGDEYSAINQVTDWPADWIAAVCVPPLYPLRTPYEGLPHATESAACRARVEPEGQVLNLMVARFPTELAMQVDLVNQGYEWYAFTFDRDGMLAFAVSYRDSVSDPTTNARESPVLQPLKRFGFSIYSSPGPP